MFSLRSLICLGRWWDNDDTDDDNEVDNKCDDRFSFGADFGGNEE